MQSINLLIKKLSRDFPELRFQDSDVFSWSPTDNCVYYVPSGDIRELLHETAHALLGHVDFSRDVELIAMETAAWTRAQELAKEYNIELSDGFVQASLDTYRDWMHARSTCPKCDASGIQVKSSTYRCVVCGHSWRVNDARGTALRRYNEKHA